MEFSLIWVLEPCCVFPSKTCCFNMSRCPLWSSCGYKAGAIPKEKRQTILHPHSLLHSTYSKLVRSLLYNQVFLLLSLTSSTLRTHALSRSLYLPPSQYSKAVCCHHLLPSNSHLPYFKFSILFDSWSGPPVIQLHIHSTHTGNHGSHRHYPISIQIF